jgi:hypothetical protein
VIQQTQQDWNDDRLEQLFPDGGIDTHPIGEFTVIYNDAAKGAKVSFKLVNKRAVFTIALKRNYSLDLGSAIVLQTWTASAIKANQKVNYDDLDPLLKNQKAAYYWLVCSPILDGNAVTEGPQTLVLNLDQGIPDAITSFDASEAAGSGGSVRISVAFAAPVSPQFGSCKIYISGYNGVVDYVAIAQSATSPFSFLLTQTSEAVTLKAVAVSKNGVESTAAAPTKALTLNGTATVPAKSIGGTAAELTTGVQVSFPAGAESNITQYSIYRAAKGAGFGAAVSIGTVAPTGAAAYTFLDTTGFVGGSAYEWYVIATNAIGNSAASAAINTIQLNTSADLPSNTAANQSNTATIDSIDNGTNATARIYGPGGVGTGYTRKTGFGDQARTTGTITGAYSTKYVIYRANGGGAFSISTTAYDAIPDTLESVGAVTMCAAGGAGGTSGGGGSGGGRGGGPMPL